MLLRAARMLSELSRFLLPLFFPFQRGKADLKGAVSAFKRALKLEPGSAAAKKGLKEAGIAFMAEFDDDLSSGGSDSD